MKRFSQLVMLFVVVTILQGCTWLGEEGARQKATWNSQVSKYRAKPDDAGNRHRNFKPVDRLGITSEQQTGLYAMLEDLNRSECIKWGGQGVRWSHVGDSTYYDAARYAFNQQQRADDNLGMYSNYKIDNDGDDGLKLHSTIGMVRTAEAHDGFSCVKDEQEGAGVVKTRISDFEVWAAKDGSVVVRSIEVDRNDRQHYSKTWTYSWYDVFAIQNRIAAQDKTLNF